LKTNSSSRGSAMEQAWDAIAPPVPQFLALHPQFGIM